MNGGRLSNDETFLQGVGELRAQLTAPAPDAAAADRALARIAVRFPEEAEQLQELWRAANRPGCTHLLETVVGMHADESAEED
ncbi:MAG TPA: hypothetical protein VFP94_06965 [Terriglobales bacterium]|nr:hypothetical protein [Terriglobales bacterium]